MRVELKGSLPNLCGCDPKIDVTEGETIYEVLYALYKDNDACRQAILNNNGDIHHFLNVYLNDEDIRYLDDGFDTKIGDTDVLTLLPAVAGGSQ